MNIGVDIRVLANGEDGGIAQYLLSLLPELFKIDRSIKFKLLFSSSKKIKICYDWLSEKNVELFKFRTPNLLFFASSRFLDRPLADKMLGGADIFFSPHFIFSSLSKNCKMVVTFHDLSFLHHPQFFPLRKKIWHFNMNVKYQAQKADEIIAVSESTKEDLVDSYGINQEKIKVIYSGIGEQFKPINKDDPNLGRVRKKYNLPQDFILYFGTLEPRKNIPAAIKCFDYLKTHKPKNSGIHNLVIAGTKGWYYKDIFKTAKNSKHFKDIIFTDFIDDKDKPYLYNLASLFVYPSFFEGFGFPPLEAMACGVPTITSNNSSLPEVVEGAAIMIDPYNLDELIWAVETVLEDESLRAKMIERGITQAKKFRWEKCARETMATLLNC